MSFFKMRQSISYLLVSFLSLLPGALLYKQNPDNHFDFVHQTDQRDSHPALGSDDAFAHFASTDESKLRLALLIDQHIDKNKDGLLQLIELVQCIQESQDKYIQSDTNLHWKSLGKAEDDDGENTPITWNQYIKAEEEQLIKSSMFLEHSEKWKRTREKHIQREQKRWKAADLNQDQKLSKREFKLFLHPEASEQMRQLLIEEKFDSIDKNNDDMISLDEYLIDLPSNSVSEIEVERKKFGDEFDLNHDNFLDQTEYSILVSQHNHENNSIIEAQHLMTVADTNRDHRLTKEEVLASYHDFLHSHATDFGEALSGFGTAIHDEL